MHCEHPLLPAFKGVFLVCINGHVTRLVQELAHEKSEVCLGRRSFVGVLQLSLQKAIVLRTYRCHRVKQRMLCVCTFRKCSPSDFLHIKLSPGDTHGVRILSILRNFDVHVNCLCGVHSSGRG